MLFRSDGLLRGSSEERIAAMRSLTQAGWTMDTLLELHCGLLDHAEDVRAAVMDVLQEIAKQKPAPITMTPESLLSYYLFAFTVSSGVRLDTFQFLVEQSTPEADQAVREALLYAERNEDFKDFVGVLRNANKLESLRRLEPAKLSKTKAAILRSALSEE